MKAALRKGCGAWYPGIRETLDALKRKGYRMAVLSNCQASYGAAHWQAFHMEQWFEYFFDCESFQSAPKSEIIRKLGDLYPPPYIVIGDRYSDLEAAKGSGSPFIAACTASVPKQSCARRTFWPPARRKFRNICKTDIQAGRCAHMEKAPGRFGFKKTSYAGSFHVKKLNNR